jgi:hypothetical protein
VISWRPRRPHLEAGFLVRSGIVSPSRSGWRRASRTAVVKTGRRPPPQAAQRGLDHGEHGAMLVQIGITLSSLKHSCLFRLRCARRDRFAALAMTCQIYQPSA